MARNDPRGVGLGLVVMGPLFMLLSLLGAYQETTLWSSVINVQATPLQVKMRVNTSKTVASETFYEVHYKYQVGGASFESYYKESSEERAKAAQQGETFLVEVPTRDHSMSRVPTEPSSPLIFIVVGSLMLVAGVWILRVHKGDEQRAR